MWCSHQMSTHPMKSKASCRFFTPKTPGGGRWWTRWWTPWCSIKWKIFMWCAPPWQLGFPHNFKIGVASYGWWKKSCTSWCGKYPIIYKVLYIPSGAAFLPSTVSLGMQDLFEAKKGETKNVNVKRIVDFDSIQRTNPLWCWSSLKNLFFPCHFSVGALFYQVHKVVQRRKPIIQERVQHVPKVGLKKYDLKSSFHQGFFQNGTHFCRDHLKHANVW